MRRTMQTTGSTPGPAPACGSNLRAPALRRVSGPGLRTGVCGGRRPQDAGPPAAGRKTRGRRAPDLLIAATALAASLPLYTCNAADFADVAGLVDIVPVTSGAAGILTPPSRSDPRHLSAPAVRRIQPDHVPTPIDQEVPDLGETHAARKLEVIDMVDDRRPDGSSSRVRLAGPGRPCGGWGARG